MRVVAALLSYPPHRFIGSELMTHQLLKALAARGHEVTVVGKENKAGWAWDGINVVPRPIPEADLLIYHAEFWEDEHYNPWVDQWQGRKVAICHNARMGVQLGLYNANPDLAVVNSATSEQATHFARKLIVHPPTPELSVVHGDGIGVVNLEASSKAGPFWELAKRMPDLRFVGIKGGYGKQSRPAGRPRSNVELLDQLPPDRMDEFWSKVRVLLVPSATESWSMAASEALAHGIPVVANPLPGLRENLGTVGVWANRDNPDEWVSQIRFVLNSWDEFSEVSKRRAVEQREAHLAEVETFCLAVERIGHG